MALDKETIKRIEELNEDLTTELKTRDNEDVHVIYDQITREIARFHEPELMKLLDKAVEGINFWYA